MRLSSKSAILNPQSTITAILVNWNTRRLLVQCLASLHRELQALDPADVRTIVVDNASSDGSASMVRERFPWVELIETPRNLGFAAANNCAIRASRSEHILLLNPDTIVKAGALKTLLEFIEAHPQAAAVGARLLNPDGSLQISCHPFPTLSRELWRLFHLDALQPIARYPMETWDLEKPRRVDVVQGAALLVRRRALEEVGDLDEGYFMYSEEVDLCRRLQRAGWGVYWVPRAQVVHYGAQSTRQVSAEMFMQLYRSKLRYFRVHRGPFAAAIYKLILLSASLARLALSPLAWLETGARRKKHLQLAGNYWRLVKSLTIRQPIPGPPTPYAE